MNKQIKIVAATLGISTILLTGWSFSLSSKNNTNDQFYTDATDVLQIEQTAIESNQAIYTPEQQSKIGSFANKYANLKVDSKEFGDFMNTLKEVQSIPNNVSYNTDTTPKDEPKIGDTESQVLDSSWGSPDDKTETKDTYGTSAMFFYGGMKTIFFIDGKVNSISQ